jgi:hypothetical protein
LGKKKNLKAKHVGRLLGTTKEQENTMNYKSSCPSQGGAREHPLDIRNYYWDKY